MNCPSFTPKKPNQNKKTLHRSHVRVDLSTSKIRRWVNILCTSLTVSQNGICTCIRGKKCLDEKHPHECEQGLSVEAPEVERLFLICTHWWACWGFAPGRDPSAASSSPGSSWLSQAGQTLEQGYWAPPPLPDRNLGSVRQSIKGSLGQSERRNKLSWCYFCTETNSSHSKKLSGVGFSSISFQQLLNLFFLSICFLFIHLQASP